MRKAFSLVELLTIVGIIAILSAIAVPNYLEAENRTSISEVRSRLNSVAIALETYKLDHDKYPVDGQGVTGNQRYPPYDLFTISQAFGVGRLNNMLTTPVAYLTPAHLTDPYAPDTAANYHRGLRYVDFKGTYIDYREPPLASVYESYYSLAGNYQVVSVGPDQYVNTADPSFNLFWTLTPYDATNGTISKGDIIRTQKNPTGYTYSQ